MPYLLRKVTGGYKVLNTNTMTFTSNRAMTKENAMKQIRLLTFIEHK